jgi:hypothetical protein
VTANTTWPQKPALPSEPGWCARGVLSGERQNVFGKAVWLYFRFSRSFRDVEALLAQRGIDLGYETIWFCIIKVGPLIARRLEKRLGSPTPGWHLGCCQRYARKLETARRCSCDLWRLLKARSRSVRIPPVSPALSG